MKQLLEFPLEDGTSVVVEVEEAEPEGGMVRAARPGEIAARASSTFEQALERLKPATEAISQTIVASMRALPQPPDEVIVTFGIRMNAAAGALIAAVGTEANYEISLTWRRKD